MWIPVDKGMTRLKEGLLAYRLWNSWWLCDHFWSFVFLLCSIYSDKSLILYSGFPLVTDGPRTLFIHLDRDLRGVPTHSTLWMFGEDLDLSPAQFPIPPRKNRGLDYVPWVSRGLLVLEWQGEEGNGCDFGGSISEILCVEEPLCVVIIEFLPNSFFQQVFIKRPLLVLVNYVIILGTRDSGEYDVLRKTGNPVGCWYRKVLLLDYRAVRSFKKKILFYTEMLKDSQCVIFHNSTTLELQIWGLGRYCPRRPQITGSTLDRNLWFTRRAR